MGALNLLGFFGNWRVILAGVVAASGLALWAYAHHEGARADRAEAAARTASRQAQLNGATAQAVDHAYLKTSQIHTRTEKSVDAVKQAPGSETHVPPDVLSAWRAGIDGLRDAGGGGSPDSPG